MRYSREESMSGHLVMWLMISALVWMNSLAFGMQYQEKQELRNKVLEMFNHAYDNYMDHAFPADELMPLSCKGRYRGTERSRGDIDDVLGNFSLTLVDTLDTLVVLGKIDEFERAVQLVIDHVSFDNDIVVSVFETNIRILGGLLGGHVMADHLKKKGQAVLWYQNELLEMAKDVGYRLLPAFNTTTGIPFPRVNLRTGIKPEERTGQAKDTCTACAGTMILEFAALSRLTGETIFEEKARKAMDLLWKQRHRSSDLMGTVINIHNGDWVRRESGVGAGIDSYYEYLLKAYIMLGDDTYLDRFNKHYDAVMRYISQGPILVDVHMHRPLTNSRNFMDALLAFWPGLQVLKGDIKPAIEIHEMLYQVTQRHNFLPEAFTTDFRVHWGHHPLRPEFVESTYFLYKATGDPHYLDVGKTVLENLEQHARVDCGFAALKDVTTGQHEDQMDSYVLSETFKYLYLLYTEREDLDINVDDYIFTTEAHLLPLSLSLYSTHTRNDSQPHVPQIVIETSGEVEDERYEKSCPNTHHVFPEGVNFAHSIRSPLKNLVESVCPKPKSKRKPRMSASTFVAGNMEHQSELRKMGIRIITMSDGRVQLLHTASEASSPDDADDGMHFMQEMIELAKQQQSEVVQDPRVVQLLDPPYLGNRVISAGPAQFGYDLKAKPGVVGKVVLAEPFRACQTVQNPAQIMGKIALLERGDCMFIDKARHIQAAGAIGGIVIDHNPGSTVENSPLFSMSGDGRDDITIPLLFLFRTEADALMEALEQHPNLNIYLGVEPKPANDVMKELIAARDAKELLGEKETKDLDTQVGSDQSSAKTGPAQPGIELAMQNDDTKVPPASHIKKIDLGDTVVEIDQTKSYAKYAETLLKIIEGPGNSKQISVHLQDLVTGETDEKIGDIAEELFKLIQTQTNFNSLREQNEYLKAVGDLIQAAFLKDETVITPSSKVTLSKLGIELKQDSEEASESSSSSSPNNGNTFEPSHISPASQEAEERLASYASEEDLFETGYGDAAPSLKPHDVHTAEQCQDDVQETPEQLDKMSEEMDVTDDPVGAAIRDILIEAQKDCMVTHETSVEGTRTSSENKDEKQHPSAPPVPDVEPVQLIDLAENNNNDNSDTKDEL